MNVGLVLFPNLTQLDLTGPYEVFSRCPDTVVSLVAATDAPVRSERGLTITPDVATHLTITQEATHTVAGQTISSLIVQVRDQFENVVTTDNSNVTIAINTGTGTLNGTKTIAAVNGVATFSTLSINTTGAFTLTVTDGSLTGDTGSSFNITPAAASNASPSRRQMRLQAPRRSARAVIRRLARPISSGR